MTDTVIQLDVQIGDLVQVRRRSGGVVLARVTWIESPRSGSFVSGPYPRLSLSLLTPVAGRSEAQRAVVFAHPDTVEVVNREPEELFDNEPIVRAHARMISTVSNEMRRIRSYETQGNLQLFLNLFDDTRIPDWVRATTTFGETPQVISYATDIRYVDVWRRRRQVKPATFVGAMNRAYNLGLTKQGVDAIAYAYGVAIPDPTQYTFEIVGGDDITRYYRNSSVHTCMSGGRNVGLYAANPDKVRMLIINRLGKFHGRALIWNTDEGAVCLDRIYPSDGGYHIELARKYAESQGWDSLPTQSFGQMFASGKHYTVTLEHDPDGRYPYMDTFRYVQFPEDTPLVLHTRHRSGWYCLDQTNGTYDGSSFYGDGGGDDNDDDDYTDDDE